jgi:hypothetical protein
VDLEERVAALEARSAIMELIARYAMAVSRRDREGILASFTSDGAFDVGPARITGVDQIREYLSDMRPDNAHLAGFDRATTSTPVMANVVIELDGDRARSTSMSVVTHAGVRDGEPVVMVRGSEYEDELECVDGTWLFTSRRHRTTWEYKAQGVEPTPPPRWPR